MSRSIIEGSDLLTSGPMQAAHAPLWGGRPGVRSVAHRSPWLYRPPAFALMIAAYAVIIVSAGIHPALHYLRYGLVLIVLGIACLAPGWGRGGHPGVRFANGFLLLNVAVVTFSLLVLLARNVVYYRFFAEAYFVIGPLVCAAIAVRYRRSAAEPRYDRVLLGAFALLFAMNTGRDLLAFVSSPSLIQALMLSSLASESTLSFVFGLFAVYYLARRELGFAAIASFLTLVSFKRIALLGVCLGAAVLWLTRLRARPGPGRRGRVALATLGLAANLCAVGLVLQFTAGRFNGVIRALTGLPANVFLMGRQIIYHVVLQRLGNIGLFGAGLGQTWNVLTSSGMALVNMHSDVLKLYLEFGPLAFSVWMFGSYWLAARWWTSLAMLIYLNVVFLTDNVFIYFHVMLLFCLLTATLIDIAGLDTTLPPE